ncbi:MAG: RNA 2',3'-cyclic phosphodiesterase [Gorillibacterium sp.]|nr:RNA 2',3'-cyclic phosphodiesterase [Gorillibacterium sp.]
MNLAPITPHLFIAITIADDVKNQVEARAKRLREQAPFRKWTHPEDLHITLKFLGAVSAERIADIHSLLSDTVEHFSPISISVAGLGTFGLSTSPRILWTGVNGEIERLRALQSDIERKLELLGFTKENRPYSPHVTLAKQFIGVASPEELLRQAAEADWQEPLAFQALEIVLFESHPGKSPMYEALAHFPFI